MTTLKTPIKREGITTSMQISKFRLNQRKALKLLISKKRNYRSLVLSKKTQMALVCPWSAPKQKKGELSSRRKWRTSSSITKFPTRSKELLRTNKIEMASSWLNSNTSRITKTTTNKMRSFSWCSTRNPKMLFNSMWLKASSTKILQRLLQNIWSKLKELIKLLWGSTLAKTIRKCWPFFILFANC